MTLPSSLMSTMKHLRSNLGSSLFLLYSFAGESLHSKIVLLQTTCFLNCLPSTLTIGQWEANIYLTKPYYLINLMYNVCNTKALILSNSGNWISSLCNWILNHRISVLRPNISIKWQQHFFLDSHQHLSISGLCTQSPAL